MTYSPPGPFELHMPHLVSTHSTPPIGSDWLIRVFTRALLLSEDLSHSPLGVHSQQLLAEDAGDGHHGPSPVGLLALHKPLEPTGWHIEICVGLAISVRA